MLPLPWRECLMDSIVIGGTNDALQEETAQNCWGLSLSDLELAVASSDVIYRFIQDLIRDRLRQVQVYGRGDGVFYLWHDVLAGQLRLNVISACHASLPFGCPIRLVRSPAAIVRAFLETEYREGIPLGNLQDVPVEEAFDVNGQPTGTEESSSRTLDVYAVRLSSRP